MAHMKKFTRGACSLMFRHYERAADENGQPIKYKNQEIDTDKSYLNYNLAPSRDINQGDFVRERCSEVKCLNRKDVNVMCSWVVTAPQLVTGDREREEKFFKEAYHFLSDRYGKENVMSAYVHMDEVTPHLHFAFVPVVKDKKKGHLKVSAHECVDRTELKRFHGELEMHMTKAFGHEIGILNDATREGNKSIDELKRQSAAERLNEVQEKSADILSKTERQVADLETQLAPLQAEYETKKAYVREFDKSSEISVAIPDYAKVKKTIAGKEFITVPLEKWREKHISANEKERLIQANKALEKTLDDFRYSSSGRMIERLEKKISGLENEIVSFKLEKVNYIHYLKASEKKYDDVMKKLDRVLSKLPPEMAKKFVLEWEKSGKQRYKDMER